MKTGNEINLEDRSKWDDKKIVDIATKLAFNKINLGEIMGISKDELYGTAALAVLFAAHGKENEATILMDGILALAPDDGVLATYNAEIQSFFKKKDKVRDILLKSITLEDIPDEERFKRAELAIINGDKDLCKEELSYLKNLSKTLKERHKSLILSLG
jgi:hypothetical protein